MPVLTAPNGGTELSDIIAVDNSIRAIAKRNPFQGETTSLVVPEGMTVRNILALANIPEYLSVIVDINGIPILPVNYDTVTSRTGDFISIIAVPTGGGGGKNAMMIISTIAVIAMAAFAPYAIGALAGVQFGATATAAIQAGAMMVGGMLANALIPAQNTGRTSQSYEDSPTYSLSAGNVLNKYGPIPQVLGRIKCVPPHAAQPYTSLQGNDQYLHVLYCMGYDCSISDCKLGETSLDNYEAIDMEVIQGGQQSTLYPWNVYEDSESSTILYGADWNAATVITRTTQPNCSSFSVDFTAPAGLLMVDTEDGSRIPLSVSISITFRETGTSGAWQGVSAAVAAQQLDVSSCLYDDGYERTVYIDWWGAPHIAKGFDRVDELGIRICKITGNGLTVSITADTRAAWLVTAGYYAPTMNPDGVTLEIGAGVVDTATVTLSGSTSSQIRQSMWFNPGSTSQWDVRVLRTTRDYADVEGDYAYVDQTMWTALRSYQNGYPVTEDDVYLIAMRIKATDQLNGSMDTFSCTAQLVTKDYDAGTGTWIVRATRNPASIYRYVLQGDANKRPLTDAEIDLTTLATWHTLCTSKGWEFNHFVDYRSSVQEILAMVAAAGRATPAYVDGQYSVVMDTLQTNPVQIFTPRNSWGFTYEKGFASLPQAYRMRFQNEDKGWAEDELIVCDDGYTEATATEIEELSVIGVTNYKQTWSYGRYYLASLHLRPELYRFHTDFEHIACTRGDLVLNAHDVIKVGLGQGRVKSTTNDGTNIVTITVDDEWPMEAGTDYVLRIRHNDGTVELINLVTDAGYADTFTVSDTILIADGPAAGELVMFGEKDLESIEGIVKEIKPGPDLTAMITCVPAAPGVHTADSNIPDFDSKITEPPSAYAVYVPLITGYRADETALVLDSLGNLNSAIAIQLKPRTGRNAAIDQTQVYYKDVNATGKGNFVTVEGHQNEVMLTQNIVEGSTYNIMARYKVNGRWCAWSDVRQATVTGQSNVPDDVTGFSINIINDLAFLSWAGVNDSDLASYEIKHTPATSGAVWSASSRLGDLVDKSATTAIRPAMQGTYLIKAIDRGNRESANATSIINTASDIYKMNAAETATENPGFAGIYDGIVLNDGELILDYAQEFFDLADVFSPADWFLTDQGFTSTGYYYFVNTVDLGAVHVARVTGAITATGEDMGLDIFSRSEWFINDDFFGVTGSQWAASIELRTTSDDPSGGQLVQASTGGIMTDQDGNQIETSEDTTWTSWAAITKGDYTARGFQFRAKLESLAWGVTPSISAISASVDMPDRIISDNDVTIDAAGTSITFSPAFYAIKGLGIAAQDMATGDYYTITSKTTAGFTIIFKNAAGVGVERIMDYVAIGYGMVIT